MISESDLLYTFDNYVVGPQNLFAHAAAKRVCNNPGKAYNPLLIYGAHGCGKTHLLKAIGNEIKKANPELNVFLFHVNEWVNQLINAIRKGPCNKFQETMVNFDVLLMDDIELVAGKLETQQELFAIYQSLLKKEAQIVVTSGISPCEMKGMAENLIGLLNSGLICDISPADAELKTKILQKKVEAMDVLIPQDVIDLIVRITKSDTRELEQCLKRLELAYSVTNQPINIVLSKFILRDFIHRKNRTFYYEDLHKMLLEILLKSWRKE